MINYIYVVKYVNVISVFNRYTYEEYMFNNFQNAYNRMLEIVKDEEKNSNDIDFYNYLLEIEKKVIDVFNPWDYDTEYWYYDMHGKEIYHMLNNVDFEKTKDKDSDKSFIFKKGDIVTIEPYPWNIYTSIPIKVDGIIADIPNYDNKYNVYIFDEKDNRFFHSHEFEKAIQHFDKNRELDINLKNVSKFIKNKIKISDDLFEEKLLNGEILATTKNRLIDIVNNSN